MGGVCPWDDDGLYVVGPQISKISQYLHLMVAIFKNRDQRVQNTSLFWARTQRDKGIKDSAELYTSDTLQGGAKKPELAKVLCENSGADVKWLLDKFNLDLSLVARTGGHSALRTNRGKERFPGMTITYALIQMAEKIAEKSDKARIITKAWVTELIMSGDACTG